MQINKIALFCISYILPAILSKQNIVVLYIEHVNEVANMLKMIQNGNLPTSRLPNIYKLLNDSIAFDNMYGELSTASNFASLITGKPAIDTGIIRGKLMPFDSFPSLASSGGLKLEEVTIAELLKDCGYATMFVGYWKLGFGDKGDRFPMKHGFHSWMGVGHPHSDWCHRMNVTATSQSHWIHPYTSLLYKTSFFWTLVLILLITLVWFKFIAWQLFFNLMIYTICTSLAFYTLLHLFMIQRSASCVLFYHDTIYQQPYEVDNLTLHFTQYARVLIDSLANVSPFFLVFNYMKMSSPPFHSSFFRTKSSSSWHSALLELDWSIGEIVRTLQENHVYKDTYILVTGSNSCEGTNLQSHLTKVYQRNGKSNFESIEVSDKLLWDRCLKSLFFIKHTGDTKHATVHDVVSVTDVFNTMLQMGFCNPKDTVSLLNLHKESICEPLENMDFISKLKKDQRPLREMTSASNVSESLLHPTMEKTSKGYLKNRMIYHYFNVEKPVLITYRNKYQLTRFSLDESGYPVELKFPWIIDLSNGQRTELIDMELAYQEMVGALNTYITDRQRRKNMWSSQFEMPIYPWLLPCANIPYCETERFLEFTDFEIRPED